MPPYETHLIISYIDTCNQLQVVPMVVVSDLTCWVSMPVHLNHVIAALRVAVVTVKVVTIVPCFLIVQGTVAVWDTLSSAVVASKYRKQARQQHKQTTPAAAVLPDDG